MDDLISRQAAIDAIDEISREVDDGYGFDYAKWREYFCELPSAEPKIIYCGECTKMHVDSTYHDCWCKETGKKVWVNHYCGYAERREVTE